MLLKKQVSFFSFLAFITFPTVSWLCSVYVDERRNNIFRSETYKNESVDRMVIFHAVLSLLRVMNVVKLVIFLFFFWEKILK